MKKPRTILSSESDEAMLAAIRSVHPFLSDHRAAQLAYRNGLRRMNDDPDLLVQEARAEEGR